MKSHSEQGQTAAPQFQSGDKIIKRTMQQLQEKYADRPRVAAACEIEGRRYHIIRHFTGQAELGKLVAELALRRADREAGL